MKNNTWIICPVCGGKTRNQIREDTVLINYPLFCPKCKHTTLIDSNMEQMLSDYGFLIYEILEPKDIQTQIIGKRDMKAFEHINYVQAVIKKNG